MIRLAPVALKARQVYAGTPPVSPRRPASDDFHPRSRPGKVRMPASAGISTGPAREKLFVFQTIGPGRDLICIK